MMIPQLKYKLVLSFILCTPFVTQAKEYWYSFDHLYLQGGTYFHYSSSDDYSGSKIFFSIEAVKADNTFAGLSLFNNSFGQFSQYLYVGKSWTYSGLLDGFHTKLTGGIIHGYKDQFRDKIPFNSTGFAPAIIPGIGYKKGRFGGDIIFLGTSALLCTVGIDF